MLGEHVEVVLGEHSGAHGLVTSVHDPNQRYDVKLTGSASEDAQLVESSDLAQGLSRRDSEDSAQQPVELSDEQQPVVLSDERKQTKLTPVAEAPAECSSTDDHHEPSAGIVVCLWPNQLRRLDVDEAVLENGPGGEMRVLEACIRWTPRLAGKLCELPTRAVTAHGEVLKLEEPIRFWCPKEEDWPVVIVQASLRCSVHELSFSHVNLAPWGAFTQHWMEEEGLVSPHHKPRISTDVREFKPHYGSGRKERGKQLPLIYARLIKDAQGSSNGKRLYQSSNGSITQTCQCSNDSFDAARSVHMIGCDPPQTHNFTFEIIRCANERAAGLRVGVCSEDGKRAWMLRLSDARLCDASGAPVRGAKPLIDNWPSFLPPSLMNYRVIVTLEMGPKAVQRKVFFTIMDCGCPMFQGSIGLPSTVRPCVHLTHKGDAVRLCDHLSMPMRMPGVATVDSVDGDGGGTGERLKSPKALSRYMTWTPERYQRAQSPKHAFSQSLRTLRPQSPVGTLAMRPQSPAAMRPHSPTGSMASSARASSPGRLRKQTPPSAEVLSVRTASGDGQGQDEPSMLTWDATVGRRSVTCAHCRQSGTDGKSPWCNRCAPRNDIH